MNFYIEKRKPDFKERNILPEDYYEKLSNKEKVRFRQVKKEEILQGLTYLEKTRVDVLEITEEVIDGIITNKEIHSFPFITNNVIAMKIAEDEQNLPF